MVKINEFTVKNYFSNPTGFYVNPPEGSHHTMGIISEICPKSQKVNFQISAGFIPLNGS